MSASTPVREVACPGCGVASVYAPTNPYRPFCSQRCKLMDLGDWASEKFRIPDPTPADDFESQSHE